MGVHCTGSARAMQTVVCCKSHVPLFAHRTPIPLSHQQGGTILGSSRGGFDLDRILESVQANGINIVFVIGALGVGVREWRRLVASGCDFFAQRGSSTIHVSSTHHSAPSPTGGDGTHRGALQLLKGAVSRKIKLSVACVPKVRCAVH